MRRAGRVPVLALVVGLTAALVWAVAAVAGPYLLSSADAVERRRTAVDIDLGLGEQRSLVFDAHGAQLGVLLYVVDREPIALPPNVCDDSRGVTQEVATASSALPRDVIEMLLVVEDAKFCRHPGFDMRATARALISNVASGSISSGGSTITQQIVKLREVGNERSFNRKIKEAVLATRLEEELFETNKARILRTYVGDDIELVERTAANAAKSQILEFYLNEVYFGNGAYGIRAAAETYFGKEDVSTLDVGDMALLASLIRSPGVFDGFDQNLDLVSRRRSSALESAQNAGIITPAERARFDARPLPQRNLSPQRTSVRLRKNYFLDEVTEVLLAHPALGDTYQERFAQVYNGGLRVYTTFRPELTAMMNDAIDDVFPGGTGEFEVAMATVDPSTGAVLALRSGPDFTDLQFNLATQGYRQPGSSFKTYVLAASIDRDGTRPFDYINGIGPCVFPNPPREDYEVANFANSKGKWDSLRAQTLRSSNCSYVRLGLLTGLEDVTDIAEAMLGRGPEREFREFPSISLGAQEVTVLEQAAGYAAVANGGVRHEPYYIERIEDAAGNVIYDHQPQGQQVISRQTAHLVSSVLEANAVAGTGRRAQLSDDRPSAGKTGTAQDFTDAWYVGYTPQMATAVWMGHPNEQLSMTDVLARTPDGEFETRRGTGGWAPAMIWGNYMSQALKGVPVEPLPAAPPPDRRAKNLTEPLETCELTLDGVPAELQPFEVSCLMVVPDRVTGQLRPLPAAVCEIPLPLESGVFRLERVPCVDAAARLEGSLAPADEADEAGEDEGAAEESEGT